MIDDVYLPKIDNTGKIKIETVKTDTFIYIDGYNYNYLKYTNGFLLYNQNHFEFFSNSGIIYFDNNNHIQSLTIPYDNLPYTLQATESGYSAIPIDVSGYLPISTANQIYATQQQLSDTVDLLTDNLESTAGNIVSSFSNYLSRDGFENYLIEKYKLDEFGNYSISINRFGHLNVYKQFTSQIVKFGDNDSYRFYINSNCVVFIASTSGDISIDNIDLNPFYLNTGKGEGAILYNTVFGSWDHDYQLIHYFVQFNVYIQNISSLAKPSNLTYQQYVERLPKIVFSISFDPINIAVNSIDNDNVSVTINPELHFQTITACFGIFADIDQNISFYLEDDYNLMPRNNVLVIPKTLQVEIW